MNKPNRQKSPDPLWQNFSRTGKIEAYLAYSARRRQQHKGRIEE